MADWSSKVRGGTVLQPSSDRKIGTGYHLRTAGGCCIQRSRKTNGNRTIRRNSKNKNRLVRTHWLCRPDSSEAWVEARCYLSLSIQWGFCGNLLRSDSL